MLAMNMDPVRRIGHDRKDVNTLLPCGVNYVIINVTAQVVTYTKTVETCVIEFPRFLSMFRNTFELFRNDLTNVS